MNDQTGDGNDGHDNPRDHDRPPSPEVVEERERRAKEFKAYAARMEAFDALRAETASSNKTAIFEALGAAGVVQVVVGFDGSGDDGGIDGIDAYSADDELVDLKGRTLTIQRVDAIPVVPATVPTTTTIREAIDTLAYDLLASVQYGWENDNGAFGEFAFDVAARSITLDFNERFTQSEHNQYDL